VILTNGREVEARPAVTWSSGVIYKLKDFALDSVPSINGTLLKEISRIERFSRFTRMALASDLDKFLDDPQYSYTVLVPNDR